MTVLVRRKAASAPLTPTDVALAQWRRAAEIRQEWLAHGLSTDPADRKTVEQVLSRVYARCGRAAPRFRWVDSPAAAMPLLSGIPTHAMLHEMVLHPDRRRWPVVSDIAAGLSRLRIGLESSVEHPDLGSARKVRKDHKPEATLPAPDAIRAGVALREVLRQGVHASLYTSLILGFVLPIRDTLGTRGDVPIGWYGQQNAAWIGHYDMLRRLGFAHYRAGDEAILDDWLALARAGGWWWPGERLCVVVERPATVHMEPLPGVSHEQVRLPAGTPVRYRDGWSPHII